VIDLWLVLAVLLVVGWYLSYTASRLDRLHAKVTATRTALDVQLLRRRMAAIEAARYLDPASALIVTDAASQALAAAETDEPGHEGEDGEHGEGRDPLDLPPWLEPTENDLSRALHVVFDDPLPADDPAEHNPFAVEARAQLAQACTRVQLARRFHNDAVAQAQRVRDKRVVRWVHLAGRAPVPQMVEIDDSLPAGLAS
jgi:hypothetical protein